MPLTLSLPTFLPRVGKVVVLKHDAAAQAAFIGCPTNNSSNSSSSAEEGGIYACTQEWEEQVQRDAGGADDGEGGEATGMERQCSQDY